MESFWPCRLLIIGDTGAYGSYGIAVASRAAVHATGPYEVENIDIESRCVYTNNPFCGAMRGFGTPQMAIAHESHMDLLAEKLGMDPLELRLLNAFKPGSETATGQKLTVSVGIGDCLEALRPHYEWAKTVWRTWPKPNPIKKEASVWGACGTASAIPGCEIHPPPKSRWTWAET